MYAKFVRGNNIILNTVFSDSKSPPKSPIRSSKL